MPSQRSFASLWSRRLVANAVCLSAVLAASVADAASARVRWQPRSTTATSYAVFVRNAGSTYGTTPHWSGNPTPGSDGSITVNVTYTPAASGANYFSVVAINAVGESALATELPIGAVDPCRRDTCVTRTSCDFGNRPNGTPCDDALFCNGPEVCLNGTCDTSPSRDCSDAIACTVDSCQESEKRCVHAGPPGCCLACDSDDPCLQDGCATGDCTAPAGTPMEVNRVRLINKASGIKLAAKASFEADPSIDPSVTGAVVEFRAIDGTVLYRSVLRPGVMAAGAQRARYRFTASRAQSDADVNGLTRLDLRSKGASWYVTAKAETGLLFDTFLEPTVTMMIRFGDEACARRVHMACSQTPALSVCR